MTLYFILQLSAAVIVFVGIWTPNSVYNHIHSYIKIIVVAIDDLVKNPCFSMYQVAVTEYEWPELDTQELKKKKRTEVHSLNIVSYLLFHEIYV